MLAPAQRGHHRLPPPQLWGQQEDPDLEKAGPHVSSRGAVDLNSELGLGFARVLAGECGNWSHGARFGPQGEHSNKLLQVRNCPSSKPQCFPLPFWFPVPVTLVWGQPSAPHLLLGAFR